MLERALICTGAGLLFDPPDLGLTPTFGPLLHVIPPLSPFMSSAFLNKCLKMAKNNT